MFSKTKKAITRYVALFAALVFMLILVSVPSAQALNYNGSGGGTGNKSFNFHGYEYVDSTHVKVFFDKQSSSSHIVKEQFGVIKHSDSSTVTISSITISSGTGYSGVSDTGLTNGVSVTLNLGSSLAVDTLYDVTMKANTIANTNGLTLGNYYFRNDYVSSFKTPDSNGNYTGTPQITFRPATGATNVPWERNTEFTVDRPVSATGLSTFLSNLSSNLKKGGTTVTQDSTIDSNAVSGAECYTPHANTARTHFFFPMTGNGSTTTCYNLGSGTYTLTVPSFTDVSSNNYTENASPPDISFTTVTNDIAGWLDITPTVTAPDPDITDTLTVTWNASAVTPVASEFDVYYSDSQFTDFTKKNSTRITGTSPYSYTVTDLEPDTTYYFRIVPANSYGEAGFSLAGSGTTNS